MINSVLVARIEGRIFQIRGRKVILDSDLALLYGVETKYLTRQVRRNMKRFPEDFMFRLTQEEFLRCQNVTSKRGGRRYLPYAFTEEGVAMLSSVLNSERAIIVNSVRKFERGFKPRSNLSLWLRELAVSFLETTKFLESTPLWIAGLSNGVNIHIMRAFVNLRRMGLSYTGLKRKIEEMERRYDKQFKFTFDALKKILEPPPVKEKRIIGFRTYNTSAP